MPSNGWKDAGTDGVIEGEQGKGGEGGRGRESDAVGGRRSEGRRDKMIELPNTKPLKKDVAELRTPAPPGLVESPRKWDRLNPLTSVAQENLLFGAMYVSALGHTVNIYVYTHVFTHAYVIMYCICRCVCVFM